MSSWTTTVPNSVRTSAPVGQTSRQAAEVQCLHTSELISQRMPSRAGGTSGPCNGRSGTSTGADCSMKATWRQLLAPSMPVVVQRHAEQVQSVVGDQVPFLAGDLAGLAADADRGVGEESDPRRVLAVAGQGGRVSPAVDGRRQRTVHAGPPWSWMPARDRYCSTRPVRAAPRGLRPGRISQVAALTSWMWTLGSSTIGNRSLAESPVVSPLPPQW